MVKNVLLIDDDEIALMVCEFVIQINAFADQIDTAKSGKEGIDFFSNLLTRNTKVEQQETPSLIFLDLNMPVMDGWDFLDEFTTKYQTVLPNTKVVILSSSVNPADIVRSKEYGMVIDFITKPLEEHYLTRLTRKLNYRNLAG